MILSRWLDCRSDHLPISFLKGHAKMLDEYRDVLTIKEVIEILHLGRNTVYRLLGDGEIKSRRVGKKYIIPKKSIIDYIEKPLYSEF